MELNPYEAPRDDSNPPLGRSASRLPSKVSFACESCGWRPWNGQLYRRRAVCKRCQGRSWALTASYTEREVSIGLLALLTTGRYFAVDDFTNQITVEKVNPNVVIELLEDRRLMLQRVSAYLTLREPSTNAAFPTPPILPRLAAFGGQAGQNRQEGRGQRLM